PPATAAASETPAPPGGARRWRPPGRGRGGNRAVPARPGAPPPTAWRPRRSRPAVTVLSPAPRCPGRAGGFASRFPVPGAGRTGLACGGGPPRVPGRPRRPTGDEGRRRRGAIRLGVAACVLPLSWASLPGVLRRRRRHFRVG